uniref:Uncharacterized protein n=1 Tax=Arundo donax TaxID=35708 RepID=A0A0A9HNH1_ARUDO
MQHKCVTKCFSHLWRCYSLHSKYAFSQFLCYMFYQF